MPLSPCAVCAPSKHGQAAAHQVHLLALDRPILMATNGGPVFISILQMHQCGRSKVLWQLRFEVAAQTQVS